MLHIHDIATSPDMISPVTLILGWLVATYPVMTVDFDAICSTTSTVQ
jgi:hypothetical protein